MKRDIINFLELEDVNVEFTSDCGSLHGLKQPV